MHESVPLQHPETLGYNILSMYQVPAMMCLEVERPTCALVANIE